MKPHIRHGRALQQGMTLIELMVAMVIGLVVVLAVTSVMTIGESQKRSTTSTNDMGQSGAYASYVMDRAVRSAGSGFTQSWNLGVVGCQLNASRGGTPILPRAAAFPGAFAGFLGGNPNNLRVAPLLIAKGQSSAGSDVIMLMGGNAAAGDVPRPARAPGALAPNELRLDNTIGLAAGDLTLLSQSGTPECLIEQVAGTPAVAPAPRVAPSADPEVLPLGGTYYSAVAPYATMRISSPAAPTFVTPLGNVAAGNVQFQLIGVGPNRTLFSYDLLRSTGAGTDAEALQALAEGVMEMRALYGIDTDNDGIFNNWVDPASTGFDIVSMMATPTRARQVVAIRVAMVLRATNYEKTDVSPATLELFGDLPAALRQTINLSGTDDRHYRYRVVDSIIPMRNMLLLPNS